LGAPLRLTATVEPDSHVFHILNYTTNFLLIFLTSREFRAAKAIFRHCYSKMN